MTSLDTENSPSFIKANVGMWMGIIFCIAFTSAIYLVRPYMPVIDFAPDQGALWYYWKLPEPTILSRLSGWVGYLLHQVAIWSLIYRAQTKKLTYSNYLHPINIIALLANAFFIVLHLLQTYYFYDGLAADTPVWSSQISVIIMLVMILILENKRRGLFFGQTVSVLEQSRYALKKYHGYYFSWAIIFTFWFHPAEATIGHLWGFFYTTLLMVQSSLFFTRAHLNRYWTVALEVMVLFHGTIVAIQTGTGWPMFFFGFATIFIVTQMHGLGLKSWLKWSFAGAYGAGLYAVYGSNWLEAVGIIARIPAVEYLLAFVLAMIFWAVIAFVGLLTGTAFRRPLPRA
jgi:hypothetical protein